MNIRNIRGAFEKHVCINQKSTFDFNYPYCRISTGRKDSIDDGCRIHSPVRELTGLCHFYWAGTGSYVLERRCEHIGAIYICMQKDVSEILFLLPTKDDGVGVVTWKRCENIVDSSWKRLGCSDSILSDRCRTSRIIACQVGVTGKCRLQSKECRADETNGVPPARYET